jgi:hypothetical protein
MGRRGRSRTSAREARQTPRAVSSHRVRTSRPLCHRARGPSRPHPAGAPCVNKGGKCHAHPSVIRGIASYLCLRTMPGCHCRTLPSAHRDVTVICPSELVSHASEVSPVVRVGVRAQTSKEQGGGVEPRRTGGEARPSCAGQPATASTRRARAVPAPPAGAREPSSGDACMQPQRARRLAAYRLPMSKYPAGTRISTPPTALP